ncbi:MAG: 50S ribosome-binding GTPase [Pirellulaceae bacterium]|jgi:tRNA modification GTPase|nr:50S ribosome-binding GTPase [Pirellulaceae bacterium]MDP7018018.1 50S ribosome-binding GTPase [Pirellulaceae bacterium]
MQLEDTIVAVASAPGGAMRGIVRATGEQVLPCLQRLGVRAESTRPHVVEQPLQLPRPWGSVPCSIYIWPAARSYTRQPAVEVHTVGSPPLLEAIVSGFRSAGARLADPGEFTLRAFLAGRLDLTQAEAVLSVIDANSDRELQVALEQLGGGLGAPLKTLRDDLLDVLAHLEAGLDFVEDDIEFIEETALSESIEEALSSLRGVAARLQTRSIADQRARVVLTGRPNVGKSQLFNSLIGESQSIVTAAKGTTRDYVSASWDCCGRVVELIDTAGVEQAATSIVDADAQQRSHRQVATAAVTLLCLDISQPLDDLDRGQLASRTAETIMVDTKSDLPTVRPTLGLAVSGRTGAGLAALSQAVAAALGATETSAVANTADRCRDSVDQAVQALERSARCAADRAGEELVAAELRVALDHLGRVLGAVYTDDVLDRIFSKFCIGK